MRFPLCPLWAGSWLGEMWLACLEDTTRHFTQTLGDQSVRDDIMFSDWSYRTLEDPWVIMTHTNSSVTDSQNPLRLIICPCNSWTPVRGDTISLLQRNLVHVHVLEYHKILGTGHFGLKCDNLTSENFFSNTCTC